MIQLSKYQQRLPYLHLQVQVHIDHISGIGHGHPYIGHLHHPVYDYRLPDWSLTGQT